MEFLFKKKELSPLRTWLIKHGVVKARNLKEVREVFTFPAHIQEQPKSMPWVSRHVFKMPPMGHHS